MAARRGPEDVRGREGRISRTRDGNPGTLTAPDEVGDYELRYLPGQADVVIVSVPITVE